MLEKAREKTKKELARRKQYNEGDRLTILQPGEIVYLRNFTLSSAGTGEAQKLNSRAIGPCKVIERVGDTNNYVIQKPPSHKNQIVTHSISNIFR